MKVIATAVLVFNNSRSARLDPSVALVIARVKSGASQDPMEFIQGGMAELELTVDRKSEETIARLKALGFEIISWPGPSTLVIGRLPIEKLEALLALRAVHFIAPHRRGP